MVKPGTPTTVLSACLPCSAQHLCRRLTLPLTAYRQVCSVEKWQSRKACAPVLSPFVTLYESGRISPILRVICPEHRGLYREGNRLCVQKLEFFPPSLPPPLFLGQLGSLLCNILRKRRTGRVLEREDWRWRGPKKKLKGMGQAYSGDGFPCCSSVLGLPGHCWGCTQVKSLRKGLKGRHLHHHGSVFNFPETVIK